ncbi:hypothetical protein CEE37_09460 [candidate division LCP-89 bacterium B3_LCP]|uniref:Uncharacterized protein n=1 Tax=candidate division LCP-89 bacterium B3_LCP TaxID=2012998 RepID=A0A532UYA5_UNCL8|nr:MAG: hypothetical protein CEE37_09460 [candidate division LCP-89 bacterium B3_LCP]
MTWVDYKHIKSSVKFSQVLAHYEIELQGVGDKQLKCRCTVPIVRDITAIIVRHWILSATSVTLEWRQNPSSNAWYTPDSRIPSHPKLLFPKFRLHLRLQLPIFDKFVKIVRN